MIEQKDKGDNFYIMTTGKVDVSVEGVGKVGGASQRARGVLARVSPRRRSRSRNGL